MTDAERIIQIYERFAKGLQKKTEASGENRRSQLESLRVAYWYEGLRQRTGIETPYGLELHFEGDSFKRNPDGTIRCYPNKWSSYERNIITPQAKTLARVELLAPGSTHDLKHLLWRIMSDLGARKSLDVDSILKSLNIEILNVLFNTENTGFSVYSAREPSTQVILDKLERRASLDSLAGLIALTLEAHKQKNGKFVTRATKAIHNVLTMVTIEIASRNVVHPVVTWITENVLSLGTPRNLELSMDSYSYLDSVHSFKSNGLSKS